MANRTVSDAKTIKGTNPQYLVEKITRTRIYESKYWKEECFALSAELLVDKAMELSHVGGTFGGNIKPCPFLCLLLKMLQIQPEKDIVIEFIKNEDYKYCRALGAMYLRLIGQSVEIYKYLEPLYNDYRKMKRMNKAGQMELFHMDEFIDDLLREERVCDIQMPRLQKRYVLEENEELEPKRSALEDDLDDMEESDEEEPEPEIEAPPPPRRHRSRTPEKRRRSRSKSPARRRRSPTPPPKDRHRRHRSRSRSPKHHTGSSKRHRSRSTSPRRRDRR